MAGIIIRRAEASDCQSILALMQESVAEQNKAADFALTSKDLEERVFGPSSNFMIFVSGTQEGQVVGYVLLILGFGTFDGKTAFVQELFVSPTHRRKGIASALREKMVQTALEKGCLCCHVFTASKNAFLLSKEAEDYFVFRMDKKAMELLVQNCKTLEGTVIREAKRSDNADVMKMILGLVEYSNSSEPKYNETALEEAGYGEEPTYRCLVAETNGALVGYCLYFFTFGVNGYGVYMEDLYISPEYRGKGVGMALWRSLVKVCLSAGGKFLNFVVLKWNTQSINIYKYKGAVDITTEEGINYYKIIKDEWKTV